MGHSTPRTPIETEGSNGNELPEGWEALLEGTVTKSSGSGNFEDNIKPYFQENYGEHWDVYYDNYLRSYYVKYADIEKTDNPNFEGDWTQDNNSIKSAIDKEGLNPTVQKQAAEQAFYGLPKNDDPNTSEYYGMWDYDESVDAVSDQTIKENSENEIIDFVQSRQKKIIYS